MKYRENINTNHHKTQAKSTILQQKQINILIITQNICKYDINILPLHTKIQINI